MLTTAKSIQLLDASGMNISPITDITSLYYEVENPNNKGIISRKYIYDEFPIGVDINPITEVSIGTLTGAEERHPENNPLYENGQLYKIVDVSDNNGITIKDDILVSNVSTYIMKGTTLREIKVKNYNLSEILSYYTPLDLMDASYGELTEDINVINASIDDISTRIHILRESLDASICSFNNIKYWITNISLIPNKFYLINDYYVGEDGCMAIPNNNDFSGPDSDSPLSLLVKANSFTNLDGKLYEMYDHSGNALKVYGTYKIKNNKVQITYMKDQYGNEAPYDFYNLKYNDKFTFTTCGNNALLNTDKTVANNIIKTDPSTFKSIPVFSQDNFNGNYIIKNNYIGFDNDINIEIDADINIQNNIIYNQNNINISINNDINLENCVINNNNIIVVSVNNNNSIKYYNGNIGNNNIINLSTNMLSELNINTSNNIKLIGNNSFKNIIILNNCDGSINLSDNIIVDNYIDTTANSSLNTTPNSVYLFGQNVYAKSFNTIQNQITESVNTPTDNNSNNQQEIEIDQPSLPDPGQIPSKD